MGDLTQNFSRHEFACKCGCGQDTVDWATLELLEVIRKAFGDRPITILSGNRCPKHNAAVGGAKDSQHLRSRAADIVVEGATPAEVFDYLDGWHEGGLGSYETFTHVDTRTAGRARWKG